MQGEILKRIRRFSFNPTVEFAASKGDTLKDATKYFILLLIILSAIIAVAVAAVVAILNLPGISKLAPLLGIASFFGIIAIGIIITLYIAVWLHIWVYLFGGRKGLKQTVKAVMYGATPCLVLG
ncbi:MAG: YIP1 family protein, partial [Candidatus Methanospirareceae archaeon]